MNTTPGDAGVLSQPDNHHVNCLTAHFDDGDDDDDGDCSGFFSVPENSIFYARGLVGQ